MSANGSNPHSLPQQNSFNSLPAESVSPYKREPFMMKFPEHTSLAVHLNPQTQHTEVEAQFPTNIFGGVVRAAQPSYPQTAYNYNYLPNYNMQMHAAQFSGHQQQSLGNSIPQHTVPIMMSIPNGQQQSVFGMMPSVSGGPPIAAGAAAFVGHQSAIAATSMSDVTSAIPRQSIGTRKRQVLAIVNPDTNVCVNQDQLEGLQTPVSDSSLAEESEDDENEEPEPDTIKANNKSRTDDETAAEIQHRFQDAVLSKAFDKLPQFQSSANQPQKQQSVDENVAKETDGSKLRASSMPEDNLSRQAAADAAALLLENAVKEKLSLSSQKSASSPPEADILASAESGRASDSPKMMTTERIAPPNVVVSSVTSNSECNGKLPADTVALNTPEKMGAELENGVPEPATVESMEAKVKRYEDELINFMVDSKDTDLDACVYGSAFLRLMRNIVKELRYVKCPKTDAELIALGIDRAGMPAITQSKKSYDTGNKGTFVPHFMQNQTRISGQQQRPPNYGGRHSDNKLRPKKAIGPRVSERLVRNNPPAPPTSSDSHNFPRKASNAWRPFRDARPADEIEAEKIKYEKLRKEIRGLLNKITPSTYDVLSEEFVSKKCYKDLKLLEIVIDLIFEKAVEEPDFCPLYSDLCKLQVDTEYQISLEQKLEMPFRKSLLDKCQGTFSSTNSDEEIKKLENELESDDLDVARSTELRDRIEYLKSKEKRRLNGIIRFIAELYRHGLLINSIINWCVVELVKRYEIMADDVYIEYAVNMIERVGASYEKHRQKDDNAAQKGEEAIDRVFVHLSSIKATLSNRVRFMIMNLEDLRKNNWVPRRGNTGPKTIEEVHNEAIQEQIINQQEREAYEKRIVNNRDSTGRKAGGGNKGGYMGRGSTDNRSYASGIAPTEKRSQAAINASQTGISVPKRDLDLKKCEGQQKLGSSRFGFFNRPISQGGAASTSGDQSGSPSSSNLARVSTPPVGGEPKDDSPRATTSPPSKNEDD